MYLAPGHFSTTPPEAHAVASASISEAVAAHSDVALTAHAIMPVATKPPPNLAPPQFAAQHAAQGISVPARAVKILTFR